MKGEESRIEEEAAAEENKIIAIITMILLKIMAILTVRIQYKITIRITVQMINTRRGRCSHQGAAT